MFRCSGVQVFTFVYVYGVYVYSEQLKRSKECIMSCMVEARCVARIGGMGGTLMIYNGLELKVKPEWVVVGDKQFWCVGCGEVKEVCDGAVVGGDIDGLPAIYSRQ